MKSLKFLSILGLLLASASASVWADHGHTRIGIGMYFGPPVTPVYYAPPPYYYYPPRVVMVPAAQPPVYIEQSVAPMAPPAPLAAVPAPPPQPSYWYYCRSSNAYYPYVKDCPEGWEQVLPQTQPR